MSINEITKAELFKVILALDVNRRGYNAGFALAPSSQIGNATIGKSSKTQSVIGGVDHTTIGYYALEYTLSGGAKVISYRGTDDEFSPGAA